MMKKQRVAAVALAASGLGATLAFATPANALPYAVMKGHNPSDPTFELVIPTPPGGTWTLFVNEPNLPGQPVVAEVTGTSGTLSVTKPPFCGTLQADAWLNGVYTGLSAVSHEETCTAPTTTTTTTPAPTTTTTVPPLTTKPPASQSPPGGGSGASQGSAVTPVTPAAPEQAPAPVAGVTPTPQTETLTGPPVLAFTGINWEPLALIGSAMVGAGLLLMRRRRVAS